MKVNTRFTRFALAMGVAGMISSQIPLSGGVAQAYGTGGGGGGRGAVQAVVLGLVGLGIYSTLSDKSPAAPSTPTDTAGAVVASGGNGTVAPQTLATVFDTSKNNADLTTFATDADKTGLGDTLKQNGPYTIFEPTNAAFAALPGDQLASLQQPENSAKLKQLLSYHIVSGKYTMQDLRNMQDGMQLPTLAGPPVVITKMGTNVLINGVQVVDSDIPASNGVIHPLGQVLSLPATPAAE